MPVERCWQKKRARRRRQATGVDHQLQLQQKRFYFITLWNCSVSVILCQYVLHCFSISHGISVTFYNNGDLMVPLVHLITRSAARRRKHLRGRGVPCRGCHCSRQPRWQGSAWNCLFEQTATTLRSQLNWRILLYGYSQSHSADD